jgi:hypothetical protein
VERRKGSGVVFGQGAFPMVNCCPKTTPDPFRLTRVAVIDKKLLAGCFDGQTGPVRPSPLLVRTEQLADARVSWKRRRARPLRERSTIGG